MILINNETHFPFQFDFNYERKILKDYEAAEERERQMLREKLEAAEAAKANQNGTKESSAPPAPNITPLQPEKSETPAPEISVKAPVKIDRSILEDFEFRALRDDPFVNAELGTINDLEELRDVLASMQVTEPNTSTESKKADVYKNLKTISFPHLSLDDTAPTPNSNPSSSSTPSSHPNLFQSEQQLPSESNSVITNLENSGEADRASSSRNTNASPIKFEIESDVTKSENDRQSQSHDSDSDSSNSESLHVNHTHT